MTGPYKQGDIVVVNHKGRQWLAAVVDETRSTLNTIPITRGITWYEIPKRDVKGLWPHRRGVLPRFYPGGGVKF